MVTTPHRRPHPCKFQEKFLIYAIIIPSINMTLNFDSWINIAEPSPSPSYSSKMMGYANTVRDSGEHDGRSRRRTRGNWKIIQFLSLPIFLTVESTTKGPLLTTFIATARLQQSHPQSNFWYGRKFRILPHIHIPMTQRRYKIEAHNSYLWITSSQFHAPVAFFHNSYILLALSLHKS